MESWSRGSSNRKSAQNRAEAWSLSSSFYNGQEYLNENDVAKHKQKANKPKSAESIGDCSDIKESVEIKILDVKILIFYARII